jgi:acetyl esterase/lipase
MKHVFLLALLFPIILWAQKKPLDHTVYDSWQSIGERTISNDGRWVVYTVTPQEGDAELVVKSSDGKSYTKSIPRGYNAVITDDSRFAVFRIRPHYKDTRDARIRKKRPEDFPKDSVGILELGKDDLVKVARVRSYKTPEKASGWVAYHKEKDAVSPLRPSAPTQRTVDSLRRTIDSLTMLVTQIKNVKAGNRDALDADEDPAAAAVANEGSDLVLRHLPSGTNRVFPNVSEYYFNAWGQKLVMEISKSTRDSASRNGVVVYDLVTRRMDTILKGANDIRNFALTEDGTRIAFVAERDTQTKAAQKFYQVYSYEPGNDSARILVDKHSPGMKLGATVSENGALTFSKSGNRLFFGTVPLPAAKDTSLVEIDLVKLDIWHYKDDYLQSQQLYNLNTELRRSFQAVYDFSGNTLTQLATKEVPNIIPTNSGDGIRFIAVTDTGRRVARQWGDSKADVYALEVATGKMTLVKRNFEGQLYPSSTGKYILLYDSKAKHYFAWNGSTLRNITSKITAPLYNEEHDMPDDPNPYGLVGWHKDDSLVYIYDRYDVWRVDPDGHLPPVNIFKGLGRRTKNIHRYVPLDPEKRFFEDSDLLLFRIQNYDTKKASLAFAGVDGIGYAKAGTAFGDGAFTLGSMTRSKSSTKFIYTKETYQSSPDIFVGDLVPVRNAINLKKIDQFFVEEQKLSAINPQQHQFNWGTSELYKWKAFDGKMAQGILYKPENFDSSRKYPMLIYFYEKLSDGLYNYMAPSPTPSRLNIPFFVSRGYLVFAPDISYTKGHPAQDAYNYIVSGAQALSKKRWVDAKNIGIQGQSWGGYQVLALLVRTNMFKAAWAGAPVVNMTSAYGGIRWESGVNRQFQYEKTQSRIGATLWEKPELYLENSPLFQLPKISTPLVVMSNDADGAVPWYQGIELYTGLRRLGKPVWLLNYNGEAHNLVERKNRKDIQVREQQFFDWLLKGEKPAKWIADGVPAVKKGKEWGLELVY